MAISSYDWPEYDDEHVFSLNLHFIPLVKLYFSSLSRIMNPKFLGSIMPLFLCIDVMTRLSHLFSMIFLHPLKYSEDYFAQYRRSFPLVMKGLELFQIGFIFYLYYMRSLNEVFPKFLGSIFSFMYWIGLAAFLSKQVLNFLNVVYFIRLWSNETQYELDKCNDDIDFLMIEEIDAHIRDAFVDQRLPEPVQVVSQVNEPSHAVLTARNANRQKEQRNEEIKRLNRHQSMIESDYSLRDRCSHAFYLDSTHTTHVSHNDSALRDDDVLSKASAVDNNTFTPQTEADKSKKRKTASTLDTPAKVSRKTPGKSTVRKTPK